jgi:inosose dehydratase
VFEMTPADAETIAPDDLLAMLAEAGYRGVDLGPVGYLGHGDELRARLERHGLDLAGGWIQLPLSDDEAFEAALPHLDAALREFAVAAESSRTALPLPTLADDGSLARRDAPGRGEEVDALSRAAWDRLVANAERAAERVRAMGLQPTFHHHAGTYVESPDEIDRFLAGTDIDLTLDTGHLVIAGGDVHDAVTRWVHRINHLHLKDVDRAVVADVLRAGGGMREVWSSGAFVAFGSGDVDVTGVLDAAIAAGFDGWIVVEQDVLPFDGTSQQDFLRQRAADQAHNRATLSAWA